MKFNKEKYKSSGRKPSSTTSSGSDLRQRKKQRLADPSTFEEYVPEGSLARSPASAPGSEDQRVGTEQQSVEASELPPSPPVIHATAAPTQGSSDSSRPPNLLDDAWLAVKRMQSVITPHDLQRSVTLPANQLTKTIAHDLAKVLLLTSELGTRYVESNKNFLNEHNKVEPLLARVSELESELQEARAKVEASNANLTRAYNARDDAVSRADALAHTLAFESKMRQKAEDLASERRTKMEELEGRIEKEKAEAVEAFKNGDEAQDWLAEAFQDGFEDAKKEISKLYPDLDLSSVSALGNEEQS